MDFNDLVSLKEVSKVTGIKLASLRVYKSHDVFPTLTQLGRLYVTKETMENIRWLISKGIPLHQYNQVDNKPHKDEYNPKSIRLRQIQYSKSGLGDGPELDSTSDPYEVPKYLQVWDLDPSKMNKIELRREINRKIEDLAQYESALQKLDKGYTGRTIVPATPGLVGELQKTIAEQERTIEYYERKFANLSK